jgi:hypothetical protein
MKESDIFRGEHPDTRSGSQWWAIVQKKRGIVKDYEAGKETRYCKICGTPFRTTLFNNKLTCGPICRNINKKNAEMKWKAAKAIV